MSLDVSPALLEKAQVNSVSEDDFLAWIRESLPYVSFDLIPGVFLP